MARKRRNPRRSRRAKSLARRIAKLRRKDRRSYVSKTYKYKSELASIAIDKKKSRHRRKGLHRMRRALKRSSYPKHFRASAEAGTYNIHDFENKRTWRFRPSRSWMKKNDPGHAVSIGFVLWQDISPVSMARFAREGRLIETMYTGNIPKSW